MTHEEELEAEVQIITRAFAPIDAIALGCATGLVAAAGLFVASAWLLLRGGDVVGPNLGLVGQFLPGYTVTWPGAIIGFLYGAIIGFAFGWSIAFFRNSSNLLFFRRAQDRALRNEKRKFLDYV